MNSIMHALYICYRFQFLISFIVHISKLLQINSYTDQNNVVVSSYTIDYVYIRSKKKKHGYRSRSVSRIPTAGSK